VSALHELYSPAAMPTGPHAFTSLFISRLYVFRGLFVAAGVLAFTWFMVTLWPNWLVIIPLSTWLFLVYIAYMTWLSASRNVRSVSFDLERGEVQVIPVWGRSRKISLNELMELRKESVWFSPDRKHLRLRFRDGSWVYMSAILFDQRYDLIVDSLEERCRP
jgi:hypothetical protein